MPKQRIVHYQQTGDLYGVQRILQYHYQPEQIDFPVTLFSATERRWYVRWDPMENWHKFLPEPFEIIRVPGDHLSSLKPPNVSEFVEKIKQQIQKFENSL
jgi:surfactin synthase thioesterase subunit